VQVDEPEEIEILLESQLTVVLVAFALMLKGKTLDVGIFLKFPLYLAVIGLGDTADKGL
jgi:hypothetical protein